MSQISFHSPIFSMELNEFSHVTPYWYRVQPNVLTEPLRLLDSPNCYRMVRNFFNRNRRTAPQKTVASQSTDQFANSSEFGALGQNLQQELQRLVAQANRLQIRCAVREGILLVLTEHLLHVEPDPQQTFVTLEQTVRELTPKLLESDPTCSPTVHSRPLPVRLYLRVAGYQQPYATHSFTLLESGSTSSAFVVDSALAASAEARTIEPVENALVENEPVTVIAEPELVRPEPEPIENASEFIEETAIADEPFEPFTVVQMPSLDHEPVLEASREEFVTSEPPTTELADGFQTVEEVVVDSADNTAADHSAADIVGDEGVTDSTSWIAVEPIEFDRPSISEASSLEASSLEASSELEAPEVAAPEQEISDQETSDQEISGITTEDLAASEPDQLVIEESWSENSVVDRALEEDAEDATQSDLETWYATPVVDEVDSAVDTVEINQPDLDRLNAPEFAEIADTDVDAVSIEGVNTDAEPVESINADIAVDAANVEIANVNDSVDDAAETANYDIYHDDNVGDDIIVPPVPETHVLDEAPIAASLDESVLAEEPEIALFHDVVYTEPTVELEAENAEIPNPEITEHETTEAISIDQNDETATGSDQNLESSTTESIEPRLVEPDFIDSTDEFEHTEITDLETQSYIENKSNQETNQERLGEVQEIEQAHLGSGFGAIEQDVTDPSHNLIPQYEDVIVPFTLNQFERIVESPVAENPVADNSVIENPGVENPGVEDSVEQSLQTEAPELTVGETTTIEELNSIAAPEFSVLNTNHLDTKQDTNQNTAQDTTQDTEQDSEQFADVTSTLAETATDTAPTFTEELTEELTEGPTVEPIQNHVPAAYEDAEFATASSVETPEAQDNHSIAHHTRVEPIALDDEAEFFKNFDRAQNGSAQKGNVSTQFTIEVGDAGTFVVREETASDRTENSISPIRLIPSVQDSASSFDRLPLDVGDTPRKSLRSRLTLSNVMLTGAVGLFFVVGGVFVLTRPCVLGRQCGPLQQAQQLTQRALTTLQTTPSALEVVDAYDQLTQANQLLEMIPFWSRYHQQAQTLTTEYSSKVEELSLVVKALNQANTAAKKSLSPPHPIQVWREVQWTWREAINLLEQVPTESSVYALAQDKLAEYESNLGSINSRIVAEQNALDRLEAVKKAAEVTDARSKIVNSIESWQQTAQSWQTILDQLQQIPQGTMAHAEAQRLTRVYQLQLDAAQKRRSQEELSVNAYNQAVGLADQAQQLDQQGQWSQAIDYWRQAITTIKQVPEATTYYTQAQAQLNSYFNALNQSEQSVKQMTLVQTVEPQLERLCSGNYELCTYTLTTEAIRVQITSEYDRIVVQGFRSAQLNGSSAVRTDTADRVNQFLQSLASISESAQVPVELYSAGGSKFGTYDLNRSSYVAP